ncbi:uncharacterized protein YjbJ (UPF0337 family) [Paenarthrobacter nitroguajacolicus]|nr:uncharacterized protein YjbJ (UPF0337 family) [Paenarthrobacter nitroguajacolicus]
MGLGDRIKNSTEEAAGKLKERRATRPVTGSFRQRAEGWRHAMTNRQVTCYLPR